LNVHGAEIFSTMLADALQTKPHPDVPTLTSPTELTVKPTGPVTARGAPSL
jgi:hypothetical protein